MNVIKSIESDIQGFEVKIEILTNIKLLPELYFEQLTDLEGRIDYAKQLLKRFEL